MKITVNRTLEQVAREFALARAFGGEPRLIEGGGFVAFRPDPRSGFGRWLYGEWEGSTFPFGEENWRHLWCQFGRWVRTNPTSVHRGAKLPKDGVAVLMVEDRGERFAVICEQWVKDPGWWDWEWYPVAVVVARP